MLCQYYGLTPKIITYVYLQSNDHTNNVGVLVKYWL
jgi:hypothetical protein